MPQHATRRLPKRVDELSNASPQVHHQNRITNTLRAKNEDESPLEGNHRFAYLGTKIIPH